MLLNSTKTFRNLISRYYRKQREQKENINFKQNLYKNIENNLQKLESEEHDDEYIIKEVRKDVELKRKILFSFGTKALKHYDEVKNLRVKTKINKSKFFDPLSDFSMNYSKTLLVGDTNRRRYVDRIIHFPKIADMDQNTSKNQSLYNSITLLKQLENSSVFEEQNKTNDSIMTGKYIPSAKREQDKEKEKDKEKDKDNINNYYCNTFNNISTITNKDSSSKFLSNILSPPFRNGRELSFNKNRTFSKGYKENKYKYFIDPNYINYIDTMKNRFTSQKRRKQRYFDNNHYGCDEFKLKYDYLNKKFFN